MNLYDYIWKRKSTRNYNEIPLSEEELNQILEYAKELKPLYPNIKVDYQITTAAKKSLSGKAPYYLMISSEEKEGHLENVGFMFQQLDLYLSSQGYGSCWQGMAKPSVELKSELPFVIAIAFGNIDNPYRNQTEFKRKPLEKISDGKDERIDAARVAPSAVNNQNWYFSANNNEIDVFIKKGPINIFERTNRIDIGIAICHLYIASEHSGKPFNFTSETTKEKKGYLYVGSVK